MFETDLLNDTCPIGSETLQYFHVAIFLIALAIVTIISLLCLKFWPTGKRKEVPVEAEMAIVVQPKPGMDDLSKMFEVVDGKQPNSQPSDAQQVSQPSDAQQFSQPSNAQQVSQPSDAQQFSQPSDAQQVSQPSNAQQVSQPSNAQQVSQPSNAQQVSQPSNAQQVSQPSNAQQVSQPSDSQQVSQPSNAQQVSQPSDSQQVSQPSNAQQVLQPSDVKQYYQKSDAHLSLDTSDTKGDLPTVELTSPPSSNSNQPSCQDIIESRVTGECQPEKEISINTVGQTDRNPGLRSLPPQQHTSHPTNSPAMFENINAKPVTHHTPDTRHSPSDNVRIHLPKAATEVSTAPHKTLPVPSIDLPYSYYTLAEIERSFVQDKSILIVPRYHLESHIPLAFSSNHYYPSTTTDLSDSIN